MQDDSRKNEVANIIINILISNGFTVGDPSDNENEGIGVGISKKMVYLQIVKL